MAAPTRPTATKVYLRKKVILCKDPTYDPNSPSLAKLTGVLAIDATLMLFQSSAKPARSTNLARAPKRIGDGETYEFVGEGQVTIGDIRYSFNQQGPALDATVKLYEFLPAGTTGFYVVRYGPDRLTDLATGQFVTSRPFEVGEPFEDEEGDAEGAELALVQTMAQTGPTVMKKAIVA